MASPSSPPPPGPGSTPVTDAGAKHLNDYWKNDFANGTEDIVTANARAKVQVVRSLSSVESTNSSTAAGPMAQGGNESTSPGSSHQPPACSSNNDPSSLSLLESSPGGAWRQPTIRKGYFTAICVVYVFIRRARKNRYLKRKEDAAALGRTIDDMLTADEREAVESGYYNQFKKLLLYGIKCRLHTLVDAKEVTLKVDDSRKYLLLIKTAVSKDRIPLASIEETRRGKATLVFRKKETMKGLSASRCFSLISSERSEPIDLEIIAGKNSYKKAEKALRGESRLAFMANTMKLGGGIPTTPSKRAMNNQGDNSNNRKMTTDILLEMLNGSSEMYLDDRKFYCNGFERLKVELTGQESFWWDVNGSLRRVSASAFDDVMCIQRKMGVLDLDETEAEKRKRLEAEEKERQQLATIHRKALARKLREEKRLQLRELRKQERKKHKKAGLRLTPPRLVSPTAGFMPALTRKGKSKAKPASSASEAGDHGPLPSPSRPSIFSFTFRSRQPSKPQEFVINPTYSPSTRRASLRPAPPLPSGSGSQEQDGEAISTTEQGDQDCEDGEGEEEYDEEEYDEDEDYDDDDEYDEEGDEDAEGQEEEEAYGEDYEEDENELGDEAEEDEDDGNDDEDSKQS